MSTERQRQEWRALEQAATPGEWFVEYRDASFYDGEQFINAVVTTGTDDIAGTGAEEQCHADAAFIAAARTAVPALLADVDALTAKVARLMAAGLDMQEQRDGWQEEAGNARLERDKAREIADLHIADSRRMARERDALAAELERVRAQLDAVPVGAINTVTHAAVHAYDMRGDRQDVTAITTWLRQREPQAAHTPTPGTR